MGGWHWLIQGELSLLPDGLGSVRWIADLPQRYGGLVHREPPLCITADGCARRSPHTVRLATLARMRFAVCAPTVRAALPISPLIRNSAVAGTCRGARVPLAEHDSGLAQRRCENPPAPLISQQKTLILAEGRSI